MHMTSTVAPPLPVTRSGTFFGEPRALGYLAFTEAWERFSYYGMTAMLVLYMSESLFLPGHVEHIAGFATWRAGLESIFGPMSTLALASQMYGIYTALVYFTPVLGGYIADRWLSRRSAVTIGALSMSAGHIAMAFDASFLLALALLIVGCGLLKGNISTQVGTLYAPDDGPGRTRGFSIFSIGINVGAVAGPLVCGLLAQLFGWHAGFGMAGVLMLLGLATYLMGYRELTDSIVAAHPADVPQAPLDRAQWRIIISLFAVMALTIFQSIAYYQNSNIALIWTESGVDLDLLGFHVPVVWFNSIDSLISIIAVPFLLALWRRQARGSGEPGEVAKIGIGAWIACAANLLLVIGCATTERVPVLVPVAYDVLLGVAFLYYWPTLLALVSRAAPPRVRSILMGTVFLSLFIANFMVGWLGSLYERFSPLEFWAMHAAIAATGGVLALVFGRRLERALATAGNPAPVA
ncbi:peptide MFS transporter [Rugamonas sp.]|uniref:peptide MFS transporter n=1 Tax=Rugamonas sp. TaxID=1926287 RepID=UPI0025CFE67F|nr:peptide MFS transporter [Rugamonas sp.]